MKKIIALLLALVMTVLAASCAAIEVRVNVDEIPALANAFGRNPAAPSDTSSDVTPSDTTPSDTAQDTTPSQTPSQSGTDTAPSQSTPETPSQSAQDTTPSQSAPQTPSNGAPSTKEEIIAYYVNAYNKTGKEAKKIIKYYDYTSQYNNILDIAGNEKLADLAKTLMDKFMVENTDEFEVSMSDVPPAGIANISITPDKISSATCKDNGSTYTVTLKSTGTDSNWEIDSQAGTGSAGSIAPLLRAEDVSDAAGSVIKFEGLHTWYGTASAEATIDKATGRITALEFFTPSVLHFDKVTALIVVKVENCNIGLLFHTKYRVEY